MQISPAWPCGRLWPASSLMAMSMLGSGRPMVPLNPVLLTGLLVPMAQVSLMPQPSIMVLPVTFCQALAVASLAAMHPLPMAQIIDGWLEMLGLLTAGRAQVPADADLPPR